jgi:hypothetical protein
MTHEPNKLGPPEADVTETGMAPVTVDRATLQAELDALRVREKAHTHEGDAIAAARRRLPMVEVDPYKGSARWRDARAPRGLAGARRRPEGLLRCIGETQLHRYLGLSEN